ncbi:CCRG-2 family RiPP [Prochlorococcus marinus]|uniref:CCRG-2 family RiPP n=1 Tax=Prochlorococcus marinus TaxID=1219 RepID=UPI0012FECAF4|nr:CCRG-2 family RiPP [Prochlorococcus marinus]
MTNNELTIEELKSVSGGLMKCEVKDTLPPVIPYLSPQVSVSRMKLGVWIDGNTVNTQGFTPTTDLPDGDYCY